MVTACSVYPPPTPVLIRTTSGGWSQAQTHTYTRMHSLAFHISSSLSERAHYRQNLALTLSRPALLCSVFTLAQNVSSLKASVLPSSCWDREGGRRRERVGMRGEDGEKWWKESKCSYTERPAREEGGVDGTQAERRGGKLFCQRKGGGVTARLGSMDFPWAVQSVMQHYLPPTASCPPPSRVNNNIIHSDTIPVTYD